MIAQPLVSVIVPVYNVKKYLPDCLESLIKQSEKNIEIIAVDDGSADSCPAILREYSEKYPNIKVYTQKNSGPGVARNTALRQAQGKYVMFCDADDMFAPNMCERLVQVMDEHQTAFAFCDYIQYDSETNVSHIRKSGIQTISPDDFPEMAVGLWCFIFRRSVIEKFEINFPPCFYAEDFAFIMNYAFISQNAYALDEPLYISRARADSLMHSLMDDKHNPKVTENIDAMTAMHDFLQKHGLWQEYCRRYLKIVERLTIFCFPYIKDENRHCAFDKLLKLLTPMGKVVSDFDVLSLAQKNKKSEFFSRLKKTNLGGTRRISIMGVNFIKIKNNFNKKVYYFLGVPLLKIVQKKDQKQYYLLGIRFR